MAVDSGAKWSRQCLLVRRAPPLAARRSTVVTIEVADRADAVIAPPGCGPVGASLSASVKAALRRKLLQRRLFRTACRASAAVGDTDTDRTTRHMGPVTLASYSRRRPAMAASVSR